MLTTVSKETSKKIFNLVQDDRQNLNRIDYNKQLKKREADTRITEFCRKKKKNSNVFPTRDHKNRTKNLNAINSSSSQTFEFPSENALNNSSIESNISRFEFRRGFSDDNSLVLSASQNNFKTNETLANDIRRSKVLLIYLGLINSRKLSQHSSELTRLLLGNRYDLVSLDEGRILNKAECKIIN